MRIEFEFDPPEGLDVSAVEGVAVARCYDEEGEELALYGTFGDPSTLTAIGLYTVALRDANKEWDDEEETD
jgi:hypothetical protein